jgi:hypothetical protein
LEIVPLTEIQVMIEKEQEVLLFEQASIDMGVLVFFFGGNVVVALGRKGAVVHEFVANDFELELVFSEHVFGKE